MLCHCLTLGGGGGCAMEASKPRSATLRGSAWGGGGAGPPACGGSWVEGLGAVIGRAATEYRGVHQLVQLRS